MKKHFEVKNVLDSVKDVDTVSRKVKVVISRMGNKDLDGDIIQPGAFTKTISERGPGGSNLIWHLTDHKPDLKSAIGKFSEIYTENDTLVGITNIPNTTWGNDVMEFYKSGMINQHSIGFRTIKEEQVNKGEDSYNSITEIMLYEGSAVLWGANPLTPTLSVGKSATKEDLNTEFEQLQKEWSLLLKSVKSGNFTDETFELIEVRINQNQERQKQLFEMLTTQPVNTVEPEKKDSVDELNLLIIKHFM